jgi:hypothetical protein
MKRRILTDRRAFVATTLATFAAVPTSASARWLQAPEIPNYRADVPEGATLWALVVFTGDELAELAVSAGNATKIMKGRFGGQRLTEYSWRNTSRATQQVVLRARTLTGRELPPTTVQFLNGQNVYVGFGRRGTPTHVEDRVGGYPYDVIFIGLIVFNS